MVVATPLLPVELEVVVGWIGSECERPKASSLGLWSGRLVFATGGADERSMLEAAAPAAAESAEDASEEKEERERLESVDRAEEMVGRSSSDLSSRRVAEGHAGEG